MGSIFGDAVAAYDPSQDEPNYGEIPYAPPQRLPQEQYGGINPNQGGFRDPVYNPANVTPGGVNAPNPDYGIFDYGRAQQESRIPYWSDFAEQTLIPTAGAALNLANPMMAWGGSQVGINPGELAAGAVIPVTGADIALNAATGGGITGIDDLLRYGGGARGAAADLYRAGMPEPSLFPGTKPLQGRQKLTKYFRATVDLSDLELIADPDYEMKLRANLDRPPLSPYWLRTLSIPGEFTKQAKEFVDLMTRYAEGVPEPSPQMAVTP